MSLRNNTPNPAHPNFGRKQTYKSKLSSRLNFVAFITAGATSALSKAATEIALIRNEQGTNKLPEVFKQYLDNLLVALDKAAADVKNINTSVKIASRMPKED